nr:helix-turn-helix domain-containing protein [Frankia umida]
MGRSVRELRQQRAWSQAELARAAGMTQSAVARFEAGGTVPTLPDNHRDRGGTRLVGRAIVDEAVTGRTGLIVIPDATKAPQPIEQTRRCLLSHGLLHQPVKLDTSPGIRPRLRLVAVLPRQLVRELLIQLRLVFGSETARGRLCVAGGTGVGEGAIPVDRAQRFSEASGVPPSAGRSDLVAGSGFDGSAEPTVGSAAGAAASRPESATRSGSAPLDAWDTVILQITGTAGNDPTATRSPQ